MKTIPVCCGNKMTFKVNRKLCKFRCETFESAEGLDKNRIGPVGAILIKRIFLIEAVEKIELHRHAITVYKGRAFKGEDFSEQIKKLIELTCKQFPMTNDKLNELIKKADLLEKPKINIIPECIEDTIIFDVDITLCNSGSKSFEYDDDLNESTIESMDKTLVKRILMIEGIEKLELRKHAIIIHKGEVFEWEDISEKIKKILYITHEEFPMDKSRSNELNELLKKAD